MCITFIEAGESFMISCLALVLFSPHVIRNLLHLFPLSLYYWGQNPTPASLYCSFCWEDIKGICHLLLFCSGFHSSALCSSISDMFCIYSISSLLWSWICALHSMNIYFFYFHPNQGLLRRAPNMVQRTEPRTLSWFSKTAWRSVRGTSQKYLSSSRRCSASSRLRMWPRWSRSSRVCLMAPLSGQPRSVSQVWRSLVEYRHHPDKAAGFCVCEKK